jgi:hypothetical protein
LRHISDFLDHQLTWVQPRALKREYVLRASDEVIANVRFRSLFGSLATGESADGCWTFKRVGSKVTVRACRTDVDIAVFKDNGWTHGGTLELPTGGQIRGRANVWGTQYVFKTEAGQVLFRIKKRGVIPWFVRLSATVSIAPAAAGTAELPWVLMLAWYLMVLTLEEDRT